MDIMGSLLELAVRQYHMVSRSQAIEMGWNPTTFARTMSRQGWRRMVPGVWMAPGHCPDAIAWSAAAVLACGSSTLVTGRVGLALHEAADLRNGQPRVVTPMADHVARHLKGTTPVKVIASRTLRPSDRARAGQLPVATVERCFLDLVVPPTPVASEVRDTLITAVQRRATTAEKVLARAERAKGLPGRGVLIRATQDVMGIGADSPFTDRVHRRLLADGLTPDPHPVPVVCPGRTLHPDITFHQQCVCIECDSMLAHSGQRDLAIDHRKNRQYKAADWDCLRIGWYEFEHGWDEWVADLRRTLRTRSR